jgi:hypothetical protein
MPEDFIQYECVAGDLVAALIGPVTGLPAIRRRRLPWC